MNDFKKTLNLCLQKHQFNQIEVGPLQKPLTIDFYQTWLQENHYGSMTYLKDHFETKKTPQKIHPDLKSVISIAQSYFPLPHPETEKNPARVALYAQNKDYHHWLKEKLRAVIQDLQKLFPDEIFLPYVDSGPVLERNWAYENRLGWFGKNTCLIHPEFGSLFFIAEILTSVATTVVAVNAVTTKVVAVNEHPAGGEPAREAGFEPLPDFCGTCQRCIDICPTQALIAPRKMKAELCISYLTIEAKEVPSPALRPLMQDWFFGCDLCQTICPWNEKVFRKKEIAKQPAISTAPQLELSGAQRQDLVEYFRWLLTASHNQIQKKNQGSPLARAGAKGLKRNALIVIANRGLKELKPEVQNLNLSELDELKSWTLNQL